MEKINHELLLTESEFDVLRKILVDRDSILSPNEELHRQTLEYKIKTLTPKNTIIFIPGYGDTTSRFRQN